MTTVIRIDHDISFSRYDTAYVKDWIKKMPYTVISTEMRESTGGNTHIKVIIKENISPIDTLMLRAVLHDDSRRIRGDLERYLFESPLFDILFDAKRENGITRYAGEWIAI